MELSLRAVTEKDIKKIYGWRNHPDVRKNCFEGREIEWTEHRKYWNERLNNRSNHSFIVVCNGEDAGLVRLDRRSGSYEVHILISPASQGRGIGKEALRKTKEIAAKLGIKKLTARVKAENAPSHKIFRETGFHDKTGVYECGI